jgi:hypothetical protein
MNFEDRIALINYWSDQELQAWNEVPLDTMRIEECRLRIGDVLGEMAIGPRDEPAYGTPEYWAKRGMGPE